MHRNEDGTLTRYGESLIASYGAEQQQHEAGAVRNMNAHVMADLEQALETMRHTEPQPGPSKPTPIKPHSLAQSERERLASALEGGCGGVRNAVDLINSDVLALGVRTSPSEKRRRNEARAAAVAANALDPLGWQATKTTLRDRIAFMYCNDILADVYFVVGKTEPKERIPAHKFVLSIGSVVFDAMFNGGLTPGGCNATVHDPLEIELPDVEVASFLNLLHFLYKDEVSIEPETVMTTLYTAKKYAVPALEGSCVEFLKQSLGPYNALMLLTQARLFDEPQLAQMCFDLIDKETAEALDAEGFTDIDLATLSCVLSRDSLRIRELPLFQAVCRWARSEVHRKREYAAALEGMQRRNGRSTVEGKSGKEAQEGAKRDDEEESFPGAELRAALGPALFLLRFPLMTPEEFANGPAQSGMLTDEECKDVFLHFHALPRPSIQFSDRPRCAIDGPEMAISRFQRIDARWGYNGMPDRIKFTVDRKIYVTGFGLHGSVNGAQEYQVTIQILHCGTGKVLAHHDTAFKCDGSTATFKVAFKEPVEIMSGVTYIASACIKGCDSHYGTKGLRRVVHPSGSPTFQFTYAAGNNNGTSVEDGQIPEIYFYTKSN